MKRFLRKTVYFIFPILIVLGSYLAIDPFRVIYTYDDYYKNPLAGINRDFVSTQIFLKNNPTERYNSFILGSSRALVGFRPSVWKQFLPVDATPFSFDASGESVYGIYTKLIYLDHINAPINNALIILCRDASFAHDKNHEGHLFIKHPVTSKESAIQFQLVSFQTYLNPTFLWYLFNYTITKTYKPYMGNYIPNNKYTANNDVISNEANLTGKETEIKTNPMQYFSDEKFYDRAGERIDSVSRINSKHLFMLNEIQRILNKNGTKYKVVLSPLYEQIKFHPEDMEVLCNVFGNHLYDFSGKNSFTDDKTNYYETSHFRPCVGDSILKKIYQ